MIYYDFISLKRILLFCFLICSLTVFGQNGTVSGTVTLEDSEPAPGVLVAQKGIKNQTITNSEGKFRIKMLPGSKVLVFSFIGTVTREVQVSSDVVNVQLDNDIKQLDEVVAIGYGTALRSEALGAVSSVKGDKLIESAPVNAVEAMQGRLAGVQIATNGAPGEGPDIKIRGISTINAGANPLYVVDGQQLDNIDNIDPNDIASIEVLKDGASAAIYGSRSANGVVMITTKKGKKNEKATIETNYTGTYSYVYNKIPVANTRQRYEFERLRAGNVPQAGDLDSLSIVNAVSVDLQDIILRPAYRNQLSLSIRGGGGNSNYYFNTSYLDDEGIVVNSGYKRINTNLNLNFDINKYISAGSRIIASYELQNGLNEAAVFGMLSFRQPNLLIFDYDGSLTQEFGGRQNPLAEAMVAVRDNRKFRGTFFNFAEIKIIPSLTFKTTLGINYGLEKNNTLNPTLVQTPGRAPDGFEQQALRYDIQQENFLNFNKKIGKSSLTALLGASTQVWKDETSRIQAVSFSSDLIPTFNNVSELDLSNTRTTESSNALSSVFSRVTYDYDKKYLIAATIRRDGSSRFGKDRRWGNFPSVSVGWVASKESFTNRFLKPIAISNLKFRVGYAVTGNERIGDFDALSLLSPGNYYDGINGVGPIQLANAVLSWESTEQTNFGVDLEFLNGRVRGSFDYYIKNTSDLLYNVPIPEEFGFSTIRNNIGSIQNKGIEADISATLVSFKKFSWNTGFNIAFNKNKVTSLADPDGFESGGYKIDVGEPLGNMYGFRNLGVYAYNESNAYTEDGSRLEPVFNNGVFSNYTLNGQAYTGPIKKMKVGAVTPGGGDIIWEDLNGDFVIDGQNDRTILGNGLPDAIGGLYNEFKYKSLSLSFLFNFNFGNQIYRLYDDTRNSNTTATHTPSPEYIVGAWRKPGDITKYPSVISNRAQNRIGNESAFVSDADYIRFQNVRLNYNLPKAWYKSVKWLGSVSMNCSINNLFTLTNYEGYNPDLGSRGNNLQPGLDNLRYPNKTAIIYGLRVQM